MVVWGKSGELCPSHIHPQITLAANIPCYTEAQWASCMLGIPHAIQRGHWMSCMLDIFPVLQMRHRASYMLDLAHVIQRVHKASCMLDISHATQRRHWVQQSIFSMRSVTHIIKERNYCFAGAQLFLRKLPMLWRPVTNNVKGPALYLGSLKVGVNPKDTYIKLEVSDISLPLSSHHLQNTFSLLSAVTLCDAVPCLG